MNKNKHFIVLFCTQLLSLSLVGSIYFDVFARVLIPPSRDPQGGMIGVAGLAYVTLPYILTILLSSLASTFFVFSVFKKERKTLIVTALVSGAISFLFLFVSEPYRRSERLLEFRMKLLRKSLNINGTPSSTALRALGDFNFNSAHWFLEKLLEDPLLKDRLKAHFPDSSLYLIERDSALRVLPREFFKPFQRAGTSLNQTTKNGFNSTTKVRGKEIRIRTPKNPQEIYLKVMNSVLLNPEYIGVNLKVMNTSTQFIIFVAGQIPYNEILNNEPNGPLLKRPDSYETIVISE